MTIETLSSRSRLLGALCLAAGLFLILPSAVSATNAGCSAILKGSCKPSGLKGEAKADYIQCDTPGNSCWYEPGKVACEAGGGTCFTASKDPKKLCPDGYGSSAIDLFGSSNAQYCNKDADTPTVCCFKSTAPIAPGPSDKPGQTPAPGQQPGQQPATQDLKAACAQQGGQCESGNGSCTTGGQNVGSCGAGEGGQPLTCCVHDFKKECDAMYGSCSSGGCLQGTKEMGSCGAGSDGQSLTCCVAFDLLPPSQLTPEQLGQVCNAKGGFCSQPGQGCAKGSSAQGVCPTGEGESGNSVCCVADAKAPTGPGGVNNGGTVPKTPQAFEQYRAKYNLQDPLNLGKGGLPKFFNRLVTNALPIIGSLFFVVIFGSGVMYMTATDAKKVDEAKTMLVNSVIGVAIVLFAYIFITNVIAILGGALGGVAK